MSSHGVLTITDRENGNIAPPVYARDEFGFITAMTYFEGDALSLNAKAGVTYTFSTAGTSALQFTLTGPGLWVPPGAEPTPYAIGSTVSVTATADGVYSLYVVSPEGEVLGTGQKDRPAFGAYTVDVYASVGDDVGLTLPSSHVVPFGIGVEAHLGTTSDSDQAFFAGWAGASAFFAGYSTEVRDLMIEVQNGAGIVLADGVAGRDGMVVVTATAPEDGTYKGLVRSASYRQEGTFQALTGQRLDPDAPLTVGRPGGDRISLMDAGRHEVWAWAGETEIATGNGHDTIVGSRSGSNAIAAGGGDDTIVAGVGLNIIDGGVGKDTYVLPGRSANYSIGRSETGLTVTSNGDITIQLYEATGTTTRSHELEDLFRSASGTGQESSSFSYASVNLISNVEYLKFFDAVLDVPFGRWLRGWVTADRAGSETFKGFESLNETRVFAGPRASYSLSFSADPRDHPAAGRDAYGLTAYVNSAGESNTLFSVERLMFDDVNVAIDMYPGGQGYNAAAAMVMIWGVDSLRDQVLAGHVLEYFRGGPGVQEAGRRIVMSELVPGAGTDDRVFVDHLIARATGKPADAQPALRDDLLAQLKDPLKLVDYLVDADSGATPAKIEELRAIMLESLEQPEMRHAALMSMALESPQMHDQVALTGVLSTGLLYHDEPIPWVGG
jgi:hypothetical protein